MADNILSMKITEKRRMTHNTFYMKLEAPTTLPRPGACNHVLIYDQEKNYKPYSPINITEKYMEFAIKVYPDGKISGYLDRKSVGDTVEVSEPIPARKCKLNEFKNVLMVAGGTGVTPIYQILLSSISTGMNTTDFTLIFLNKTKDDVFLKNELEALRKKSNGKLRIMHVFSEGIEDPDSNHVSGRLNKNMLLTITNGKMFEFVYICGPPRLYESFSGRKKSKTEQGELQGILKELGYNESNVWKL